MSKIFLFHYIYFYSYSIKKKHTENCEKFFINYQKNSFLSQDIQCFCNLPGLSLIGGGEILVANKLLIPPNRKNGPANFHPPFTKDSPQ